MRIINCAQGSPSWWEAKMGIPSASNFSRIITSRGLLSSQADGYIAELIADRISASAPYFTSQGRPVNTHSMQNGQAVEPEARNWYCLERDCEVQQVGFCVTDDGRFGCSPDGLVDPDGGLELKCPELKNHLGYVLKGRLPPAYKAQVHGCLVVTGRKWWDFMSYSPGASPLLLRVEPDEYTDALRKALEKFWDRYQEVAAKTAGLEAPGVRLDPGAYEAALAAIGGAVSKAESPEALNDYLPTLAGLNLVAPIKAGAWDLIKRVASERGWTYDSAKKVFQGAPEF